MLMFPRCSSGSTSNLCGPSPDKRHFSRDVQQKQKRRIKKIRVKKSRTKTKLEQQPSSPAGSSLSTSPALSSPTTSTLNFKASELDFDTTLKSPVSALDFDASELDFGTTLESPTSTPLDCDASAQNRRAGSVDTGITEHESHALDFADIEKQLNDANHAVAMVIAVLDKSQGGQLDFNQELRPSLILEEQGAVWHTADQSSVALADDYMSCPSDGRG
uniref:Uncharacterized protein n=1 Tax=Octactis speculum TaxID=3111310 RepID=A0A7S2CAP9_9STRA|mmetsp:Transcript_33835/g.45740  ORF Transcript_33835/g.45740 Transcript_33835/m.45740 type:complete len:218 (+) Transcript_33835:37-690(+)